MTESAAPNWTDKELETAKSMWLLGNSAREIAAALPGRSRCAVIGIISRKGWARQSATRPVRRKGVPKAPNWTAEQVKDITALWLAGKAPAEIAAKYPGRTEQAVLSLGYRQGLKRVAVPKPEKVAKPKSQFTGKAKTPEQLAAEDKARVASTISGQKAVSAFCEPANDDAVPFMKRRRDQCAWPVGRAEGAGMMCCGDPVDETATASTQSYCARHRSIASVGIKEVKAPRESNIVTRRGPSRSVWDGGRVA